MEPVQRSPPPSPSIDTEWVLPHRDTDTEWVDLSHRDAGIKYSKYPAKYSIRDKDQAISWLSSVINRATTSANDTITLKKDPSKSYSFKVRTILVQNELRSLVTRALRYEQPHLEATIEMPEPDDRCGPKFTEVVDKSTADGFVDLSENTGTELVVKDPKYDYFLTLSVVKA